MKIHWQASAGIVLATLMTSASHAQIAGVQFSADMVSRGPDGQVTSGKMFVGDGQVRMEMAQQGREIIRISDQNQFVEWIIFPDQQSYMERRAQPGESQGAASAKASAEDPCAGMPGLTCTRMGEEMIGGRKAVKWEMVMTHEGDTMTRTQWLDAERGLPLKHSMPNGESMEMALLGNETVDGRNVEKWEMTVNMPNQAPSRTLQWYDPELKLSVREEFPGGYIRELTSIRVGEQPDHLFRVPAGYSRTEMPQAGN